MKFAHCLFILLLSILQISFAGELTQRNNSSHTNSAISIKANAITSSTQSHSNSDQEKINQLEGQINTLKSKLINNNWATLGLCGILIFANLALLFTSQSQFGTQSPPPYNDPRNAGNKTQCLEYIAKTIMPLCDNPFTK